MLYVVPSPLTKIKEVELSPVLIGVFKVHTTLSWCLSSEYFKLCRGTFHLQMNLKGYPSTGSLFGFKISIP